MEKFVRISQEITSEDVTCPFCGQGGFDLIGLKLHFERGYCDVYNDTDTSQIHSFFA